MYAANLLLADPVKAPQLAKALHTTAQLLRKRLALGGRAAERCVMQIEEACEEIAELADVLRQWQKLSSRHR